MVVVEVGTGTKGARKVDVDPEHIVRVEHSPKGAAEVDPEHRELVERGPEGADNVDQEDIVNGPDDADEVDFEHIEFGTGPDDVTESRNGLGNILEVMQGPEDVESVDPEHTVEVGHGLEDVDEEGPG